MATRTSTRAKVETIGVFGLGETPKPNLVALLDNHLDGKKTIRWIVPATKALYTETIGDLVDYLLDNEIPYDVLVDDTSDSTRDLRTIVKKADNAIELGEDDDPVDAMVKAVKDAEGYLFVAWDPDLGEKDGGAYDLCSLAAAGGIEAFDLCNGLDVMQFDGEAEPAEDDGEEAVADPSLPPYADARKMGIRKLKSLAEEQGHSRTKVLGPLKDPIDVLALLYPKEHARVVAGGAVEERAPRTLEDEVSTAAHKAVQPKASSNGHGDATSTIDAFVDLLAERVAAKVKALLG
jgi:hypothetical protein